MTEATRQLKFYRYISTLERERGGIDGGQVR